MIRKIILLNFSAILNFAQGHTADRNQNVVSHFERCKKLLLSLQFWSNYIDSTARLGINTIEHASEMEFSVPRIEYPLGGSSKKGSHVYFLLQDFWVILLFCQIVLLFDINVVLMPTMVTWCHNSTIWSHNSSTIAINNRMYTWLPFLLLPPSGYSVWGTENFTSQMEFYRCSVNTTIETLKKHGLGGRNKEEMLRQRTLLFRWHFKMCIAGNHEELKECLCGKRMLYFIQYLVYCTVDFSLWTVSIRLLWSYRSPAHLCYIFAKNTVTVCKYSLTKPCKWLWSLCSHEDISAWLSKRSVCTEVTCGHLRIRQNPYYPCCIDFVSAVLHYIVQGFHLSHARIYMKFKVREIVGNIDVDYRCFTENSRNDPELLRGNVLNVWKDISGTFKIKYLGCLKGCP